MQDRNSQDIFPVLIKENFKSLGTEISVQLVAKDVDEMENAKKDLLAVRDEYERYMKIFNRFESDSELSKLNNDPGVFHFVSDEMRNVVKFSLQFHLETEKFFDPRILENLENIGYSHDFEKGLNFLQWRSGGDVQNFSNDLDEDLKVNGEKVCFSRGMDFSGIAKGFITDQVASFLRDRGWKNFLIDSGGDMYFSGLDDNGEKWTVDIEGISHDKLMFSLGEMAIATSGIGKRKWEIDGERFHHIVNPKESKQFSFELKSVTVIANSTIEADVWAKTLFLMGRKDGMLYANEHGKKAVFLDYRNGAWISFGAKELLCKII